MNNYKGISLWNTSFKVLSNIIFNQLKPYKDKIVRKYIPGFYRKWRSTVDQIHILLSKLWKNDMNTQ